LAAFTPEAPSGSMTSTWPSLARWARVARSRSGLTEVARRRTESVGERITDSRITADGRAGDPACAEAGGGRCVGVFLFDGGRALIRNNTISSPGVGISFQGRSFGGDSVLDNRVACPGSGAARHASGCIDSAGSPGGNVLVGNSVSALISDGITIAGQSGDTVTGNSVDGTTDGSGIVLLEVTNSTVRDNVAMDNGDAFGSGGYGMFVSGDANLIKRNTASRNAGDGIFSSGASTLVANVARDNGGLGIQAVDGAIDGGRNRASGNADPQCLGVSCTP
jgi:parallel beta-helix repeat protein